MQKIIIDGSWRSLKNPFHRFISRTRDISERFSELMKCSLCSSFFPFVFLRVFCSRWSGHINWDTIKKAFLPNSTTCLSRAQSKWIVMQWSCSYCSTHKNAPLCSTFSFWCTIWIFMDYCFFFFFWIWCNHQSFAGAFLVLMNLHFDFEKILLVGRKSSRSLGNELIHFFGTSFINHLRNWFFLAITKLILNRSCPIRLKLMLALEYNERNTSQGERELTSALLMTSYQVIDLSWFENWKKASNHLSDDLAEGKWSCKTSQMKLLQA